MRVFYPAFSIPYCICSLSISRRLPNVWIRPLVQLAGSAQGATRSGVDETMAKVVLSGGGLGGGGAGGGVQ